MCRNFFLLFLFPLFVIAKEHNVPLGSDGNRLVLTVKNLQPLPLKYVQVVIEYAPEWIQFDSQSASIDSISSRGRQDAQFTFRVLDGETGQSGSVNLLVKDENGKILASRLFSFRTELVVNETKLSQNYPNPGNPTTTIGYTLHEAGNVKLEIYNVLGQRVRTFIDEHKPAGKWSVLWDGKDEHGIISASGIYIVRLQTTANGKVNQFTSKILLQK